MGNSRSLFDDGGVHMRVGYTLMTEEHGPRALVEIA